MGLQLIQPQPARLALDPGDYIDSQLVPLLLLAKKPQPPQRDEAAEERFLDEIRSRLPRIGGGAAGIWNFTDGGRTLLLNGTLVSSDTYKIALFLSTSNLTNTSTTYAALTNEVANAVGYTTGGISITMALSGTTSVKETTASPMVWTAAGGPITARFGVIYEVAGNVLCYCLLDSTPADVTATDGNTLTVTMNASGIFTLT